jgi:hypothetical protein
MWFPVDPDMELPAKFKRLNLIGPAEGERPEFADLGNLHLSRRRHRVNRTQLEDRLTVSTRHPAPNQARACE